jgi:hypothetical protein
MPSQSPYTPQLRTIPEESGQQISYQEFADTVNRYNSTQNTIEVRPSIQPVPEPRKPQSRAEKITKLVVVFCIVVIAIVVICIVV